MAGIKFVVILVVAAFDLAVVARGIRTNEFVADTESGSGCLEQRGLVL